MKQSTPWNKSPHRSSSHRGGRRHNTGSYSLKYPKHGGHRNARGAFFDTIKERLNFACKNLAGKEVTLKLSSGILIKGILIASMDESLSGNKITLQYCNVISRPEGNTDPIPQGEEKYVVQWTDMDYVLGSDDNIGMPPSDKIKTDADIARKSISSGKISGRQLKPAGTSWLQSPNDVKELELSSKEKPGPWDQFKVNEEKFNVKGTFKEDLYTTSLDKSTLTSEQIANAKKTAREIENKSSSNSIGKEEHNQKLQEEQDEETQFSAVHRISQTMKSSTRAPLNFAAAVMNGKPQTLPKPKERYHTPARVAQSHKLGEGESIKREQRYSSAKLKDSSPNKYQVSDRDFSVRRTAANFRQRLLTPRSKNWDAHAHTKQKIKESKGKSREDEINEFKLFSSKYDSNKAKRKTLNVNAKEFKPPTVRYTPAPTQTAGNLTQPKNESEEEVKISGPAPSRQPATPTNGLPQNLAQQPGVWQVPIPPHMPMNFYHPVMLPPGAQMYPQNANGNLIMPGQPYLVHMIPPTGMHPYAQGQRVPANFGQPQQLFQVAHGIQPSAELTDAQKQIMQVQAQQFQQAQQQDRQQPPKPTDPKA